MKTIPSHGRRRDEWGSRGVASCAVLLLLGMPHGIAAPTARHRGVGEEYILKKNETKMFKCCKKPNQKQQKCPTSIILQYKTFSNPCNTCLLVDGKETRRRRMSGRWGVLWVLERRLRSRGSRVWNTSTNLDGPEGRRKKSEQRIEARTVRIGLPTNQWK